MFSSRAKCPARWVSDSILVGLVTLSLQLSGEPLLAGRATFTGSNDAVPLVAGFSRDVLEQ